MLAAAMLSSSSPVMAQSTHSASPNRATATLSATTAAYRAAPLDDGTQERRLSPGAIIGLICAIAASSVALGVAFGLRRRIDRIAGPDPDKADDE